MNYNEAMPCAPESSKIDSRIGDLENFTIELDQLISSLAIKLSPVLQPESPVACQTGCAEGKDECQSPVARQISILTGRLRENANYLRSLMSRLEI
jgi:hypothetical protein